MYKRALDGYKNVIQTIKESGNQVENQREIDIEIMDMAEKFVKDKYPNLKEGSQEFTDKLMEKYNSLK